jgi:hypothetical protein
MKKTKKQNLTKVITITIIAYTVALIFNSYWTLKNANDIAEMRLEELRKKQIQLKADYLELRIKEIEAKEEYIETRNEAIIEPEVTAEPPAEPPAEPTPKPNKSSAQDVEQQIRDIAQESGFKWIDYLVRLAKCESSLRPDATNNKNNNPSWSIDRGLFQINDYWHSNVSDECAFDIECSTKYTMDKINAGYQKLWVCNDIVLSQK